MATYVLRLSIPEVRERFALGEYVAWNQLDMVFEAPDVGSADKQIEKIRLVYDCVHEGDLQSAKPICLMERIDQLVKTY